MIVCLLSLFILMVACSPEPSELVGVVVGTRDAASDPAVATKALSEPTVAVAAKVMNRRVEVADELKATHFLLPFDGIRPIYEPEFVVADRAPYQPEELVMGVALDGEAKAYPVTVLRFREMVNDELAGIPILVTW
jgi:hypothetical protein